MALANDIQARILEIATELWDERSGRVVPDTESLTLKNDGVRFEGTVLYADLAGSTAIVSATTDRVAAEI